MHIYNRISIEQIKLILSWYEQKKISSSEACVKLGVKRRRFFELWKAYTSKTLEKMGKKSTRSANRISESIEQAIRKELEAEKALIEHKAIPTWSYNYTHVRDEVERKTGKRVSAETVRKRAHEWNFAVIKTRKEKAHARMILTEKPGVLLQHDSSVHLFAPFSEKRYYLITTLDDFSRKLLYARFCEEETAWDHIMAVKMVILRFGIPVSYYVDNHSIFRFVQRMESYWRTPKVDHRSVLTSWARCLSVLGAGVIHALSPQAKGKIERPYRWLQDRVVRRCAKEHVTDMAQAQEILNEEVNRYNSYVVHSSTGEVPDRRFERMLREKQSGFKPFFVPKPYRAIEDVFCIREERVVNGYQHIAWRNQFFPLPAHIPVGASVALHIVPDKDKPQLRIWYQDELADVIFLHPRNKAYVDSLIEQEVGIKPKS